MYVVRIVGDVSAGYAVHGGIAGQVRDHGLLEWLHAHGPSSAAAESHLRYMLKTVSGCGHTSARVRTCRVLNMTHCDIAYPLRD